jgi:hypothetical protein
MPLIDQIAHDMVAAMKGKQEARLSALRMIKAALMKLKVDSPKPLDEAAEMQVLKQLIKQRIDAAEMYRKAAGELAGAEAEATARRAHLLNQADKEEGEKKLIESYLPAGASVEEMDAAIAAAMAETGAASVKQMGLVMKAVQTKLQGKSVDGKALSDKVRSKLS